MSTTVGRKPYCKMCGALEGIPHHDENYKNQVVVLTEHNGDKLCQPCLQGTKEIELERSGTPEGLLARATRLQTEFWNALNELEAELGIDIDSARDLEGTTIEDFRAEQEEGEAAEG